MIASQRALLALALAIPGISYAQAPNASTPGATTPQGGPPPIQDTGDFYILNFDETNEGLTLEKFVKICQVATGTNFTYVQETAAALSKTPLRMYGSKRIPKGEFYSFFQIMMIMNDFVCSRVGPEHLAVVLIQNIQGNNRTQARQNAVYVTPDELDKYADQPAVLITTVIDLPNTDVRNLSNSMRPLFPDQNTQQLIPVGTTNSVVIMGFGSQVASTVKMLRFIDEASRDTQLVVPEFEVVPLEFAAAEELADTITELLESSRRAAQARTQQQAAQGVTGQLQQGQTESKIMVDARTNSLLVMAMPEDMPRIKDLIAKLDTEVIQGERTYHIYNLNNVDAEELAETLDEFIRDASRVTPGAARGAQGQAQAAGATASRSGEVVVVADKTTNSLLIAASRSKYQEVLELIQRLDERQDQVLIETALVELTGQDSLNLAVELGLAEIAGDGGGEFGVSNFGLATYDDTDGDGIPDVKVPNITTGLTAGILQGDDFSLPVLISALQERRDTNVLNVPSVLVNNNGSAQVESKDAQPTTQITATGGVSGQTQENFREYVEAGITLDISPTISASRYLRLNINLEVSTFVGAVNGAIPPPKLTRKLNTVVNVPDGDTMVIGGIITDNKGRTRRSLPWIGDIPVLGYLFSDTEDSQNKTTLYFFVTPHIMRDRDFADLAKYSFERKMGAADAIGADRIRLVDPSFGQKEEGVDLRGFEVPLYRGPSRGEVKGESVGLDAVKVEEMLDSKAQNAKPQDAKPEEKKP
jgi:general secretion pathway protein D